MLDPFTLLRVLTEVVFPEADIAECVRTGSKRNLPQRVHVRTVISLPALTLAAY